MVGAVVLRNVDILVHGLLSHRDSTTGATGYGGADDSGTGKMTPGRVLSETVRHSDIIPDTESLLCARHLLGPFPWIC